MPSSRQRPNHFPPGLSGSELLQQRAPIRAFPERKFGSLEKGRDKNTLYGLEVVFVLNFFDFAEEVMRIVVESKNPVLLDGLIEYFLLVLHRFQGI